MRGFIMIFGECPYCDEFISNGMPDKSPAVFESVCDNCGKTYWIYASRIGECVAYTQDDFKKSFKVDKEHMKFERVEGA
jgi:hypothetical protein